MTEKKWQVKVMRSRIPWDDHPVRPAEISGGLTGVMLARENTIEDARYAKIVPNRFVVEVSPENYTRNYQPIEKRLVQQWRETLLEHLTTTNSRMGRKEYRFGGPVQILIRPVAGLQDNQVRILSQVNAESEKDSTKQEDLPACLIQSPGGRRWRLRPGVLTIGRDESCDIVLDSQEVQDRRLVSSVHATIRSEEGQYLLFDGKPGGKPSLNGTYVNYNRVPAGGMPLKPGDIIILAALDPARPLPDTPGVVSFRFQPDCSA